MSAPDDGSVRARVREVVGERELPPERVAELSLTIGCALRQPEALEAFDQLLREEVARVVRRLDPSAVDEATQLVRERLLLPGADGRCRIEAFRAEAPLRGWVRAVALRTALNERRAAGRDLPMSSPPDVEAAAADPELALMQARYRESFREAFGAAVAALSVRERNVLRLHLLDGMTLARIAVLYQKDTSTVSRWLEHTRRALQASTRAHLAERLQLSSVELDSVMRAADAEMSVSLHRLLAPAP